MNSQELIKAYDRHPISMITKEFKVCDNKLVFMISETLPLVIKFDFLHNYLDKIYYLVLKIKDLVRLKGVKCINAKMVYWGKCGWVLSVDIAHLKDIQMPSYLEYGQNRVNRNLLSTYIKTLKSKIEEINPIYFREYI